MCSGGSQYRRASGSARGSSTTSSSLAAWCSSHSRTYRSVVPVRTASCDEVAARLLREPDTARVAHQDKWCRAPTPPRALPNSRSCNASVRSTAGPGSPAARPRRTAPVRPSTSPAPPSGRAAKPRHGIVSAHMVQIRRRPDVTAYRCWLDARATAAGEQIAPHLARSDGNPVRVAT